MSESGERLLTQALAGSSDALCVLLDLQRDDLRRMLRARINPDLRRRIDESDIIQDALMDAVRAFPEYAMAPRLPFRLWLRNLAGLKLVEAHRKHLGTQKRDARREYSLDQPGNPEISSRSIAEMLSTSATSVTEAAIRAEMIDQLHVELEAMDETDREVLALHHFERLTMEEIGLILSMSSSAVGRRYLQALKHLKNRMPFVPDEH